MKKTVMGTFAASPRPRKRIALLIALALSTPFFCIALFELFVMNA